MRKAVKKYTRQALLSIAAGALLWAQAPGGYQPSPFETKPNRGEMPFASIVAGEIDKVDTTSGNLSLSVPLAALPPWRGGQQFGLSLVYNSSVFDVLPEWATVVVNSQSVRVVQNKLGPSATTGGWKYNFRNIGVELEERRADLGPGISCGSSDSWRLYRLRVGLPDGSQHTLHLKGQGTEVEVGGSPDGFYPFNPNGQRSPCATTSPGSSTYPSNLTGTLTYFTTDGSFLKLEVDTLTGLQAWRLFLPDGSRIIGVGEAAKAIDDASGNRVAIADQCNDVACTDISTYIETVQPAGTPANAYTRQIEIHYNATNWRDSTTDQIRYRGYGQTSTQYHTTTVNWTQVQLNPTPQAQRDYLCWKYGPEPATKGTCSLRNMSLRQVSSIVLPIPNRSYAFGYRDYSVNGYGQLGAITTPTGIQYSFTYEREGTGTPLDTTTPDSSDYAARIKTRRRVGAGQDLTWTYVPENNKTTLSGPDGTSIFYYYDKSLASNWFKGLTWKTEVQASGEVVERIWSQNPARPHPGSRLVHCIARWDRQNEEDC